MSLDMRGELYEVAGRVLSLYSVALVSGRCASLLKMSSSKKVSNCDSMLSSKSIGDGDRDDWHATEIDGVKEGACFQSNLNCWSRIWFMMIDDSSRE